VSESEVDQPSQPGQPGQPGDGTPPPPPAAPPRTLKRTMIIGALLLGLGLWLVLAMLPGILSRQPEEPAASPAADAADARRIQANLFYVSADGAELVSVVREVPFGATAAEQATRIVEAQVRTPTDGNVSAIPNGTKVRAVFLGAHGDAYVDLSSEVSIGHGGGTLNEALAVFAIVNAITSNLPDVTAVQILVDGKEVDSLAGHLDLRQPIGRASDWIRKGQ
jgi:spore germination protein GerM